MSFLFALMFKSTVVLLAGLGVGRTIGRKGSAHALTLYKASLLVLVAVIVFTPLAIVRAPHAFRISIPPDDDLFAANQTASANRGGPRTTKPSSRATLSSPAVSVTPPTHQGTQSKTPLPRILLDVWCLVGAFMLVRILGAEMALRGLRRNAAQVRSGELYACLTRCATEREMVSPALFTHPAISTPCLAGILAPAIYVPASFNDGADLAARAVFHHELTHLRNRDCAWRLLSSLTCALLWPNPLVWLLRARLEETSEEVCDQATIESGLSRPAYAKALWDLSQSPTGSPGWKSAVVDVVGIRSNVGRRISKVLESRSPFSGVPSTVRWAIAAFGALAALGTGLFVTISSSDQRQEQFQEAASELPSARAEAKKAGLAFQAPSLVRSVPEAENAASHYLKAGKLLPPPTSLYLKPWQFPWSAELDEKSARMLRTEAPAMAELETATSLPHCDFRRSFELGSALPSPELLSSKISAELLCVRARVEAFNGDYTASAKDIGRVGKMFNHLMEQPTMIDALVAIAIHSITAHTVELIVSDAKGEPACAQSLLAAMSVFPESIDLRAPLSQELTQVYEDFSRENGPVDLANLEETLPENDSVTVEFNAAKASIRGIDPKTAADALKARMLQIYTAVYSTFGDSSLSPKERVSDVLSLLDAEKNAGATHAYNAAITSYCQRAWPAFLRYDASQQVTLVGLEQLADPSYNELAKASKQLDPFTDEPLHVSSNGGAFMIYSVGWNQKDEHGRGQEPADDVAFVYPWQP